MTDYPATLHKEERLYSRKVIETLFKGSRSRGCSAFPLRLVYMPLEAADDPTARVEEQSRAAADGAQQADAETKRPRAKMLISVPKRCFKRAVKRNRVKRQVREAYRKNKSIIADKAVALAFIWQDTQLHDSEEVERKVIGLLRRVSERLDKDAARQKEASL